MLCDGTSLTVPKLNQVRLKGAGSLLNRRIMSSAKASIAGCDSELVRFFNIISLHTGTNLVPTAKTLNCQLNVCVPYRTALPVFCVNRDTYACSLSAFAYSMKVLSQFPQGRYVCWRESAVRDPRRQNLKVGG